VHEPDPSPLGHMPVNTGSTPDGAELSVTDTPDTGPFSADTCTLKDAVCPGLTLDWEFWTLTHSSAGLTADAAAAAEAEEEEAGDAEAVA